VEHRQPALLNVSLVGVYEYATEAYRAFLEPELDALERLLQASDLIIGFNIRRFDLEVLAPYFRAPIGELTVLDIMDDVTRMLGHRVSLNSLAQATLGEQKTGSGLDALRYFREGRWKELTAYCLHDVQITKELYEYGLQHDELKYISRDAGQIMSFPVNWNVSRQRIASVLETAFKRRLRVELTYFTSGSQTNGERTRRAVDIYHLNGAMLEGYCHLRRAVRHFRVDQIVDARPTFLTYQIPADYHTAAR
jgi:hypothetical protein